MKKNLLLTFLLLTTTSLTFAQITITSSDFPMVGDTGRVAVDTLPVSGITVGNAGPGQNWDFVSVDTDRLDTNLFVDPATLPEAADFPLSNVGIVDLTGDTRIYSDFNIGSIEIQGFAGDLLGSGSSVIAHISPPQVFVELPLNYQDAWSSAYTRFFAIENPGFLPANYDSIYFQSLVTAYDTVDGWGTLLTPLGFYDGLRQVSITYILDSIFARDTLSGWEFIAEEMDSSLTYRWWTPGIGPTVEASMDSSFSGIEEINYELRAPQVGILDPVGAIGYLEVYPNPVTASTRIEYRLETGGEVEITLENLLGQRIATLFPTTRQAPGEYMLHPDLREWVGGSGLVLVKLWVGDAVKVTKLMLDK